MKAFSKETNGFYRVFYTDTGHVLAWVETKKQARAMVAAALEHEFLSADCIFCIGTGERKGEICAHCGGTGEGEDETGVLPPMGVQS